MSEKKQKTPNHITIVNNRIIKCTNLAKLLQSRAHGFLNDYEDRIEKAGDALKADPVEKPRTEEEKEKEPEAVIEVLSQKEPPPSPGDLIVIHVCFEESEGG